MIEKQRFYENRIMWIIFPLILATTCIPLFNDPEILKNSFVSTVLGLSLTIALLLLIVFIPFLETEYNSYGITYRFFPFHLKKRTILWSEVNSAYVREYKPVLEYGGWGLRGLGAKKAYNVSGNIGLQLELKNGKKILFGTRKKEELEKVIGQFSNKINSQMSS